MIRVLPFGTETTGPRFPELKSYSRFIALLFIIVISGALRYSRGVLRSPGQGSQPALGIFYSCYMSSGLRIHEIAAPVVILSVVAAHPFLRTALRSARIRSEESLCGFSPMLCAAYIFSGASMPSKSSAVTSCRSTSRLRRRRKLRLAASASERMWWR